MPYESNSFLTPSDLLDKIRVFLIAQGFTVDAFFVEAPGKRLHMHKGSFFINLKSIDSTSSTIWPMFDPAAPPQIGFNVGTGYNPANSWRDQAGVVLDSVNQAVGCSVMLHPGPFLRYWFDYDDAYKSFVAFLEISPGVWRWMGFGEGMLKAGVWSGGAWITSSSNWEFGGTPGEPGHTNAGNCYSFGASGESANGRPLTYVRADVDSWVGKWIACSPALSGFTRLGNTSVAGGANLSAASPTLTNLQDRARNALNARSVLLPVQIFANRDGGGSSILGTLPNVYVTNNSGMLPGQAYQEGTDWFVPFPGDVGTRGSVIRRV